MKAFSLTEGKVAPTLVRFALPFMLSSLLQSLYGAADLFVVGQYAGAAAVSGVSIGSQIMSTVTMLILSLSMGGTVLIGNCIGQKNDEGAATAIGTMTVLACQCCDSKTVVLIGSLTGMKQVKTNFETFERLYGIHYIIPENASFATAIGAALSSLRKEAVQ